MGSHATSGRAGKARTTHTHTQLLPSSLTMNQGAAKGARGEQTRTHGRATLEHGSVDRAVTRCLEARGA